MAVMALKKIGWELSIRFGEQLVECFVDFGGFRVYKRLGFGGLEELVPLVVYLFLGWS